MLPFWNRHKATITMSALGAAKAILDNYWVFTNIGLAEDNASDPAGKFFYMLLQVTVSSAAGGYIGFGIDMLRKRPEEEPMLEPNRNSHVSI